MPAGELHPNPERQRSFCFGGHCRGDCKLNTQRTKNNALGQISIALLNIINHLLENGINEEEKSKENI